MPQSNGFQEKGWYGNKPMQKTFVTEVEDADYDPSALTDDVVVGFTSLTDARAVTISAEDLASGSVEQPRLISVRDLSGSCQASQALSVTLEGGANINGSSSAISIAVAYGYVDLLLDGTSGFITGKLLT